MAQYKKASVSWIDSSTSGGWADPGDCASLVAHVMAPCESLGYIVSETDDVLILAQSLDSEQNPCNLIGIPKLAIRRVDPIADHDPV